MNTSILNSYILYHKNPMFRVLSHRQFRLQLAHDLCARYPRYLEEVPRPRPIPPASHIRLDSSLKRFLFYGSAIRRCTKWYRKLAFEIIWGTSLLNAHFLYNEYSNKKKMSITEFREEVILPLLERNSSEPDANLHRSRSKPANKHYFIQKVVNEKKIRGRCAECYKIYGRTGKEIGERKKTAPQVYTICSVCEKKLCRNCFNNTH